MSRFAQCARGLFKRHPFLANSIIYGCLYVGAEYTQQVITKRYLVNETTMGNNTKEIKKKVNLLTTTSATPATAKVIVTDRIAVRTEKDSKDIDYATLGRYAVMGTLVYAPTLYTWYKWLDRTFPGTMRATIVKKLLMDQFLLTPYLLTVFYTGMSLMEGAEDPFLELREKFMPTFTRSCMFWLPAQMLNFVFVAPRFRVIYMAVCGYIWVNILCWIKRERMQFELKNHSN